MAIKVTHVRDDFRVASPRIKMLVVGEPGSGKTRSASTWPNVLYANAEGGLMSVRDRDVRSVKITSTSDLDDLRSTLEQTPEVRANMLKGPVDTVVIDTVDEIARLIIRERLEAEKHETMEMRDWGYLGDQLRSFVRGYRNLDLNVVFNVHVKGQEDAVTGRLVYKPSIQGAMGDELAAYVDEAVLMIARPTTDPATGERIIARYLQTFPDPAHDWLKDRSGKLPMEFPINFEDDYRRLAHTIFEPDKVREQARIELEEIRQEVEESNAPTAPAPEAKPAKKAAAKKKAPEPVAAIPPVELLPVTAPPLPPEIPVAPEPEPEPEPEPVPETVPEVGTATVQAEDPLADLGQGTKCSECGRIVESNDYLELSELRYGVPLCREDFVKRKARH